MAKPMIPSFTGLKTDAFKTAQEAIELQTAHLQASIERFVGEVSKISETCATSVKSAAAPLRERVTATLKAAEPVA